MHPDIERSLSLSQSALDFELAPSKSAKDADAEIDAWARDTQEAQHDPTLHCAQDIRYGARPRQMYDVYRPLTQDQPLPCLIFIHGGFWQKLDKSFAGFAAKRFTDAGWTYVALGYTLTPEVTLSDLVDEIAEAIAQIIETSGDLGIDPNQIWLAGHSAGGHLSAAMLCDLGATPIAAHIAGAVLISGVFDLAPIAKSYVNTLTPIAAEDIPPLSPLRHKPQHNVPVHVVIGGDEPQAFQDQSNALRDIWRPVMPDMTYTSVPGCDHFDILQEFSPALIPR